MQFESLDGYCMGHFKPCEMLREQRVVHMMTQKQVAEKAHIPLQSYQKFESGERNVMTASFQVACRVLEALEMDIARFFHGDYAFGEELGTRNGNEVFYKKSGMSIDYDPDNEVEGE